MKAFAVRWKLINAWAAGASLVMQPGNMLNVFGRKSNGDTWGSRRLTGRDDQ
jgi:hypothetical protein